MPHWYLIAAAILTVVVQVLKVLPGIAPVWNSPKFSGYRFLVPLALGSATAAIGALSQGLPLAQVLLAAAHGIPEIGAIASGTAAWLRESPVPWSGPSGGKITAIGPVALVLLALGLVGCSPAQMRAVSTALSDVAVAIAQGNTILDSVDSVTREMLVGEPDARSRVANKVAAARNALVTASDATQGAQALTQGDVDKAFSDFRTAWTDLQAELDRDGITKALPSPTGFASSHVAAPAPVVLPVPLALHLRIHGS